MRWLHLTLSARGRKTLYATPEACRRSRHRVFAFLRDRLGLFAFADDHVHLVIAEDERRWPALVGSVRRSLQAIAGPLQPPHLQPVDSRQHLENLVGYAVGQTRKHGLRDHPALSAGGCFSDLIGARCAPGFRAAVLWSWLPRWRPHQVWATLDLTDPGQASADQVESLHLPDLVRIAGDAFDVDPRARSASAVAARHTAAHLALSVGVRQVDAAAALGLSKARLSELARDPPAARHIHVVLRRIALENSVRQHLARAGRVAQPR